MRMRNPQLLCLSIPRSHVHPSSDSVYRQLRKLCLLEAILGRKITTNDYFQKCSQPRLHSCRRKSYHSNAPSFSPTCALPPPNATKITRTRALKAHPRRCQHTAAAEDDEDRKLELPKAPRSIPDSDSFAKSSYSHARQDQFEKPFTSSQLPKPQRPSESRYVKIIPHDESVRSLREKLCSFLSDDNVVHILFVGKDPEILGLVQQTANGLGISVSQDGNGNPGLQKNNIVLTNIVSQINSIWTEQSLFFRNAASTKKAEDRARFDGVVNRSWKLWESTFSGMAAAMPLVNIQEVTPPGCSSGTSSAQILRVELSNKDFDIHLFQDFTNAQSWLQEFPELAQEYSTQLAAKLKLESRTLLRFQKAGPQEFLSRAWSKLGWGAVTFEECLVDNLSVSRPFNVWQSQLHASKKGAIGKPQVWFTKKEARQLTVCAAVQEAYQEVRNAVHRGQLFLHDAIPILSLVSGDEDLTAGLPSMETSMSMPLEPFPLQIDSLTLRTMLHTLRQARAQGLPDNYEYGADPDQNKIDRSQVARLALQRDVEAGRQCCERYVQQMETYPLKDIITARKTLPIMMPNTLTEIIENIISNDVVILSSATGSGKTTQVPQIILDHYIKAGKGTECNILCTQPRRIAATSVARHVAYERNTSLGDAVGYHVRFDDKSPKLAGSITYATTGLALKLLELNHVDVLSQYSHIILDEVHVRDLDTDILLTRLRDFLAGRKSNHIQSPKLILMSATIDTSFFKRYFDDAKSQIPLQSTSMHIPGSRYDVCTHTLEFIVSEIGKELWTELEQSSKAKETQLFLRSQHITVPGVVGGYRTTKATESRSTSETTQEDEEATDQMSLVPIDFIAAVIKNISSTTTSGDILVFLPGLAEIDRLYSILEAEYGGLDDLSGFRFFKLHSAMYETNDEVFKPLSLGCRRIILATNIAETSLTLRDVVHVVDSGRSRINVHDATNQRNDFFLKWISKAEIAQRRGRAGRVCPGHYYAMYSESQFEELEETLIPEIHRSDLTRMILCEEILSNNIWRNCNNDLYQGNLSRSALMASIRPTEGLLLRTPSPVSRKIVQASVEELERVKALDRGPEGFIVSELGKALSRLPLSPAVGKAVLLGVLFQCMVPLLIMAVERQDMPLFGHSTARRQVAEVRTEYSGTTMNDRMATVRGFNSYSKVLRKGYEKEKAILRLKHFIRDGSFFEMAAASSQIQDLFIGAGILPCRPQGAPKHSFSHIPRTFNIHSRNVGLIKAISLIISGARLAVWKFRHFRTKNAARVLIEPRSVNNFKRKLSNRETKEIRKEGDLIAYETMRVAPEEKYPWLYSTSRVSALTAILFGDSVMLENDNTFVIDGWLRYTVDCEDRNFPSPAKIIFELRKALNRWLAIAFSNVWLHPVSEKVQGSNRSNSSFLGDDPLHRVIVENLSLILEHEEEQFVASVQGDEADDEANDNMTPDERITNHDRSASASILEELRMKMLDRIQGKHVDAHPHPKVGKLQLAHDSSIPIRKMYSLNTPIQSVKSAIPSHVREYAR